jgi:peptidyl-prolyl cis-trans isomerase C
MLKSKLTLGVSMLSLTLVAALPAYAQDATSDAPATDAPVVEAAPAEPAAPAVTAAELGLTADTVVATVNGTDITLGHMVATRDGLPDQYKTLEDPVLFKGILDQLVQQTALGQAAEGKLTKRDTLNLENQRRGYVSAIELQQVVDTAVTDETIQAAYELRIKDLVPGTEYRASHILVESQEIAADLKTQIDGGADFAELAKTNSSDGSAANGGDLGWFGLGMMVKPFEDAVVGMKPGEVSGPIETQFGWHLVKLDETRIAAAPALDDLREELASEIETKALQDHIDALTAAATITRPGDAFDPSVLKDEAILAK